MALALSLPMDLENRQSIIVMVFGIVLFTLIVQGLSISSLIKFLGLASTKTKVMDYELLQGELITCNAAIAELEEIYKRGEISQQVYDSTKGKLVSLKEKYSKDIKDLHVNCKDIFKEQQLFLEKYLVEVKKDKLHNIYHQGIITDEVHRLLNAKLDEELEQINTRVKEQET